MSRHSAVEAVRDRIKHGTATVTGTEVDQIHALYKLWTDFKFDCVARGMMDPDTVELVIEDYVLFPGEKPGRSTTAPERIAWGFEGYRLGKYESYRRTKHYTPVFWQKSGAASRFKKDRALMTSANAWIPGRDHERSALAHMILRANIIMDNRPPPARGKRPPARQRQARQAFR